MGRARIGTSRGTSLAKEWDQRCCLCWLGVHSVGRMQWKIPPALFSWQLSSSVLWWLQGAVEEGLGLSSAIITALIHAGTPRSVSNSSRDTLCVQPCCRQYNDTLLLFTQECMMCFPCPCVSRPYFHPPLHTSRLHSLPIHPAINWCAFICILGPSCAESSEMHNGPGQC